MKDQLFNRKVLFSLLAVVMCLGFTAMSYGAATVSVDPAEVESPAAGESLMVNINIAGGAGVAGYQATVNFDPTALEYASSANADYLPAGAFATPTQVSDAGDSVTVSAAAIGGTSDGDGTLATVTFTVLEAKASTIGLTGVVLSDANAVQLEVTTADGMVTAPAEAPAADESGDDGETTDGETTEGETTEGETTEGETTEGETTEGETTEGETTEGETTEGETTEGETTEGETTEGETTEGETTEGETTEGETTEGETTEGETTEGETTEGETTEGETTEGETTEGETTEGETTEGETTEGETTEPTPEPAGPGFDVTLAPGLNMISIPLMPETPYTAKSLAAMLNATVVIQLDAATQSFVGYTVADEGDGFGIDGGMGYIVNTPAGGMVKFTGSAWDNQPEPEPTPAEPETETEGETIAEGEGEGEGETTAEGEGETTAEGEGEGEGETTAEGEGEGEGETTAEGEGEGEGETTAEGEGEGEGETTAEGEGEGEGETTAEGEGEGEGETTAEGEGEGEGETTAEGDANTDAGENGAAAAPALSTFKSAWAFVVTSDIRGMETGTGYTLVAENLRTGAIATENVTSATRRSSAVWADLNRKSVVEAGDRLEVALYDERGTIVSGPFQRTVSTVDIRNAFLNLQLNVGDVQPEDTILAQNYPNPFNPETWIPYQLSQSAEVSIHIHNVAGHLVRTLDLGLKPTGSYMTPATAAYWDGKNSVGESVASGIYFYTLQTADFAATRRMVILK